MILGGFTPKIDFASRTVLALLFIEFLLSFGVPVFSHLLDALAENVFQFIVGSCNMGVM